MHPTISLALRYVRYYMKASNSRGHGTHSPFVFEFITQVLNDNRSFYAYEKIEGLKNKLRNDQQLLYTEDFGAGAANHTNHRKKISTIARSSLSSKKFGRLLFRLANFYPAQTIIEMGSSLGISTAYLASANTCASVITLEGSADIAEIAAKNFNLLGLENIRQVTGNFDETLAPTIESNPAAGLIFIDGNHRKTPVLAYFARFLTKLPANAVIIIHDIHWSGEMEEAWTLIQQHPSVRMSIDIFSAGLIFFREEFKSKQHFIIRF